MELKTITVTITKNLGNYENVKIEGEWSVDPGQDISDAVKRAVADLEESFNAAYKPKEEAIPKPYLMLSHPKFNDVCKALHECRADIELVRKNFIVTSEAMAYFHKHNLI